MQRFSNMVGTRAYNFSGATRTAFSSASSSAVPLGALNALREVMITASKRCFVRFGASDVAAADETASGVFPIEAGEKFHLRIPADVTHFAVIRDTEDGVIRTYPVI